MWHREEERIVEVLRMVIKGGGSTGKIFIRRHARSKLGRRVEMTCNRGIVPFSDKIVEDKREEKCSSRCLRSISFLFSSFISMKYIYF